MNKRLYLLSFPLILLGFLFASESLLAQETSARINGTVTDTQGEPLIGATVRATHVPSGTEYGMNTGSDGRFSRSGLRVGGPYMVEVSYVGYETVQETGIQLSLGTATSLDIVMEEGDQELDELVVRGDRHSIISSDRTGSSTSINSATVSNMPTIDRRIEDLTRLTPSLRGSSAAGQTGRQNHISVDGSAFNDSFGLGGSGSPGNRTGVSPISLDAIEEVQVNVAPYDVTQGGFTSAGINTVTKSGTNTYQGSAYYTFRNQGLVGTEARGQEYNPGEFNFDQLGFTLGGPVVEDRLFFFASYEQDARVSPMTTFEARQDGQEVGGSTTRVLESDMEELSSFLAENFDYETGPWQGYDGETASRKLLLKLDYNLDDRNTMSLRYNHLDSSHDQLMSNSGSLGTGSRRTNPNALNFANSNYFIQEDIRSIIGEWNSAIGDNMANTLKVGYTYQDESRDQPGDFFPMVDILQDGSTYTSFGTEPFTAAANELRYSTFQFDNEFRLSLPGHELTFGAELERFESENVFFPGSQSVYVYDSMDDFYQDAQGYLDDPNRTESDVEATMFQVRYSNQPDQDLPIQPLEIWKGSLYAQDQWQATDNLSLTMGLRMDVPFFGDTAFNNPDVEDLDFMDEDGNTVRYSTDQMPDPNPLWSPRLGFNWNVHGSGQTQVRGGTGIFSGPPPYVWISNQVGNNGVMTGFESLSNTTDRPFNPDPDHYKPTDVTGEPADQYELAFTDPDFRFPQVWRSSIGIDQELPWMGLVASAELMYNRDVNGVYYINANLPEADSQFEGVDDRARWTEGTRIHDNIDNAIVLKNQNEGYAWDLSLSLERPFEDNWFAKLGYNYGEAQNTVNPGSIAFGSWNSNPHVGSPNNPGLGYTGTGLGHRLFGAASYRAEYFELGATTFSIFVEGGNNGTGTYTFNGDLTGTGFGDDLIYIHENVSEMNFVDTDDFTAEEQAEAWDAYIEQDPYLSQNRGQYAERNGVMLPWVFRTDLSIQQELFANLFESRNALTFRMDILNVGNLFNSDWGVGQVIDNNQPLIVSDDIENASEPEYRLQTTGDNELINESFRYTNNLNDVFQLQFSLRYNFN